MVVKLIPSNISIIEQLEIRDQVVRAIEKWTRYRCPGPDFVHTDSSMQLLEEECGLRMRIGHNGLSWYGFEMVDEKKFIWFKLKFL